MFFCVFRSFFQWFPRFRRPHPDSLVLLTFFLSFVQWASFSSVPPWIKPLATIPMGPGYDAPFAPPVVGPASARVELDQKWTDSIYSHFSPIRWLSNSKKTNLRWGGRAQKTPWILSALIATTSYAKKLRSEQLAQRSLRLVKSLGFSEIVSGRCKKDRNTRLWRVTELRSDAEASIDWTEEKRPLSDTARGNDVHRKIHTSACLRCDASIFSCEAVLPDTATLPSLTSWAVWRKDINQNKDLMIIARSTLHVKASVDKTME